jgi:drug/metabolite transporter (DMT)-like permease
MSNRFRQSILAGSQFSWRERCLKLAGTTALECYVVSVTLVAIALALASAMTFAFSTSLQHRVAGESTASTVPSLIRELLGKPAWLAATVLALIAQLLQAAALYFGSLTLVGPMMILTVVLALVVRAWLDGAWPRWGELVGAGMVAIGIALLLIATDISQGGPAVMTRSYFSIAGAGIIAMGGLWVAGRLSPLWAAVTFAVAAGLLFGISSGLLKAASEVFVTGGWRTLVTSGTIYGQVVVGITATSFNQRAYQLAPLSVSMPLLNVVTVLTSLTFGWWVFAENPVPSGASIIVMAGSLGVMALGLTRIAQIQATSAATLAHKSESH